MDNNKIQIIKSWIGTGSVNFFGLPFAGKDTQGAIFAEILGGTMISGGDILRHNQDNEKIQTIMAKGEIIPSDLFEEIVLPYLSKTELQGKPLILSEVGRLKGEEQVIIRATKNSGHPTKAVILLNLQQKEIWKRFEDSKLEHDRGERADDRSEVLQNRLDKFQEKVMPVIELYRNIGLLIEVDGSKSKDEVTTSIIDNLYAHAIAD